MALQSRLALIGWANATIVYRRLDRFNLVVSFINTGSPNILLYTVGDHL